MSTKHTIASLSALVVELTTRLTALEARVVELEATKVTSVVETSLLAPKARKPRVQKQKEAVETDSSDSEPKKLSNPTGPAAFNSFKTKFIKEHPDVPKDEQLFEATIAYRMEKDSLTREAAIEQYTAAKVKRSPKSKLTAPPPVVDEAPIDTTSSSNASIKMPWEVDTTLTKEQIFDQEVHEKLQAMKKEVDGRTYYISNTNTCFVFIEDTVESALAVGTYNEKKNTVRLNKDGKAHFA